MGRMMVLSVKYFDDRRRKMSDPPRPKTLSRGRARSIPALKPEGQQQPRGLLRQVPQAQGETLRRPGLAQPEYAPGPVCAKHKIFLCLVKFYVLNYTDRKQMQLLTILYFHTERWPSDKNHACSNGTSKTTRYTCLAAAATSVLTRYRW